MSDINVTRLGKTFFAEVKNVNLKQPLNDETFSEIHDAFMEYGVLLFARQHLSDDQQVEFSFRFGPLEDDLIDPSQHMARMSNLNEDGSLKDPDARDQLFLQANQQWHSDSTFLAAPAKISLLSGHKIPPEGGETEWADMAAAWQALSAERQAELDGLVVEHDFQRSRLKTGHEFNGEERSKWPPLPHPLVRRHEETGQKALYVGSQAERIIGLPEDEGADLIAELIALSTQDQFIYRHPWTEGDLVVWDNRRVNHRGRPWKATAFPREIHRTTVKGTAPTVVDGKPVDEYERWQSLSRAS
jgi:alpha-ketoglutarate-dependent 2,4-dichlorophenoxyacetate dioxygenase